MDDEKNLLVNYGEYEIDTANYKTLQINGVTITPTSFIFNDVVIEDAGEAHNAFLTSCYGNYDNLDISKERIKECLQDLLDGEIDVDYAIETIISNIKYQF